MKSPVSLILCDTPIFYISSHRVELVRESHAVSLAQLATEQDRLYQKLEELRSVNDVIDEVLDKANPYQLQSAYQVRAQTFTATKRVSKRYLLCQNSKFSI